MSTRWFSKLDCSFRTCSLQACSCCLASRTWSTKRLAAKPHKLWAQARHAAYKWKKKDSENLTSCDFVSSIVCKRAISCSARRSRSLSSGFTGTSFAPFFFLLEGLGGMAIYAPSITADIATSRCIVPPKRRPKHDLLRACRKTSSAQERFLNMPQYALRLPPREVRTGRHRRQCCQASATKTVAEQRTETSSLLLRKSSLDFIARKPNCILYRSGHHTRPEGL